MSEKLPELIEVVFIGYDTVAKCWRALLKGEIPIDGDDDPIIKILLKLKKLYIEQEGACIVPYYPVRYEQNGVRFVSIGFIADYRVKNEDDVMARFLNDFVKELELYTQKSFFDK